MLHAPPAAAAAECPLYPIGISAGALAGRPPGSLIDSLPEGAAPGGFGWLTWGGGPGTPALIDSLTAPGDSHRYVNPDDPADRQVSIGDWIQGRPGLSNSSQVRGALDRLKGESITVPVWDAARGAGAKAAYRVWAFARVQLLDYHLPNENRITIRFLGYVTCNDQNLPPLVDAGPDVSILAGQSVELRGVVSDDGLPAPGFLDVWWTQVSGPGAVEFGDFENAGTSAAFPAEGVYVLRLNADDGELFARDEATVTVDLRNKPPVAEAQTVVINEDEEVGIVLAGSDADGDTLTFFIVTDPAYGTLSPGDSTGGTAAFIYTPTPDYNGEDAFEFKVSDGLVESAPAAVSITILPVNDPPEADAQTVVTDEDTAVAIILSGSDIDGDALTYVITALPVHGTLSAGLGALDSPSVVYTPHPDYNGADSFAFVVDDGLELSEEAIVSLVVRPVNDPPLVSAGPDLRVTVGETVMLEGVVTDDGDPEGSVLEVRWSLVGGIGLVELDAPDQAVTAARFLETGIYTLRLEASDSEASGSDEIIVTVLPINRAPVVTAGPRQLVVLPGVAHLTGTVADDGLPEDGMVTWEWAKASGPGAVTFGGLTELNTTAAFEEPGDYVLRLTASDAALWSIAEVKIAVRTPAMNEAPIVSAGVGKVIGLTNVVVLDGFVSDDGLPLGQPLLLQWSVVSGPGEVTFSDPASAESSAAFGSVGTYVLRLTASDSELSGSDEVTVTVYPRNQPPVVDAGPDQTLVLPDPSVLRPGTGYPMDVKVYLSQSLLSVDHWDNSLGQPGITGVPLGSFLNVTRNGLDVENGTLVVAGGFTNAGGVWAKGLARYDGANWHNFYDANPLPYASSGAGHDGTDPGDIVGWLVFDCEGVSFCNEIFDAAAIWGGEVYVGGLFKDMGNLDGLKDMTARWDGARWHSWGFKRAGNHVRVIKAVGDKVYVGGNISFQAVDATAQMMPDLAWSQGIAVWDGAGWHAFGEGIVDVQNTPGMPVGNPQTYVNGIAVDENGRVYAGGRFTMATPFGMALNAALWDGDQWRPLGAGLAGMRPGTFPVNAVALADNGDLYAGGSFTNAGGMPVRNVARWDGAHWRPLGDSPLDGVNGTVEAIAIHGRDVYVGGQFTEAGGVPAWRVAKWNGEFWSSLGHGITNGSGNGIFGTVFAMTADDTGVHVGGMFTLAGGLPANNLAQWRFAIPPGRVAHLQGQVTDDGLPSGSTLSVLWSQVSGPGEVTFTDPGSAVTTAAFSEAGVYVLRLSAGDSEFTVLDEVTITVVGNKPPAVTAGPDLINGISEMVVLQGLVEDDGLPHGANLARSWSVVNGPGTVIFGNRTEAITTARFDKTGVYVLRLTANDTQFSAYDDVTVVVIGDNRAPTVHSGSARTIPFGVVTNITASTLTDDGLPFGVTNVLWSQLSGPGIVSFGSPTGASTTLSFSLPGVYVLRLIANDSELASFHDVTYTVTMGNNAGPIVSAGPAQSLTNLTTLLRGSVTDDGLPPGAPLAVQWFKSSGPGTVTFNPPHSPVAWATFSQPGAYLLGLRASDSLIARTNLVSISFPNQRPVANAGPDRTIVQPAMSLLLNGTAADDGQPNPVLNPTWTKISGPGIATFENRFAFATAVSFSAAGTHVLRLSVSDGHLSGTDDITIVIAPPGNEPPVVDAGPSITLEWPVNNAELTGTLSDDGLPSGTLIAEWSKAGGPGNVVFSNPTVTNAPPVTTAVFSEPGVYVLRLVGSDSALANGADVTVHVLPPGNQPPWADAGEDQTTTVNETIGLAASVTDDGLPLGSAVHAAWQKLDGPGPVYFAGATNLTTNAVTTARFVIPGSYVLGFSAADSEFTVTDSVNITVLPLDMNQPPQVHAGDDLIAEQYSRVALAGTVTDDGLPEEGHVSVVWSRVSGPGHAYFENAEAADSIVTFYLPGTYVLRLTATDGRATAYDDVTITVVPPLNQPPVAYAGPDLEVTRPNAAVLHGAVFDDGLPAGYPLTFAWSKVSGPGEVVFDPPSGQVDFVLADSRASFSAAGDYVLRLTGSDSEWETHDEVTVTVFPGINSPPYVDAGPDQNIALPQPALLHSVVFDDGLEQGMLSISWSVDSGPGPVQFSTINGVYRATFAVPGVYWLRLTAHDGSLTNSDTVRVTVFEAEPPRALIASPMDGGIVTEPTAVVGTAASEIIEGWILEFRVADPSGEGRWTVLATGAEPVTDDALAMFDPTLLLNGIYELRLVVSDVTGRTAMTGPVSVIVDRNMKIGHFTISFSDLAIPVPGLPLEVTRTYDSRAAAAGVEGDFGIGWTMDIRNVRLQKNRPLGVNWEETSSGGLFPTYSLAPIRERIVTITFPDDVVQKFRLDPVPLVQPLAAIRYPQWNFTPIGNTRGTLVPASYDDPDGSFLIVVGSIPGPVSLYDLNFYSDNTLAPEAVLNRYPTLFRYTSPEGFSYLIDEIEGLRSVSDPNGNTLVITPDSFAWTNAVAGGSTVSIAFERDANGRVTRIVDALGAEVAYEYDASGSLSGFIDRAGVTNTFLYSHPVFGHHLTAMTDGRGIVALENEYDAEGRLAAHYDASGNLITFGHDLSNNREIIRDRLGNATIHEYDDHGNVTRTIDANGGETVSVYDENGNLLSTTDPLGRTTTYTYDAVDNRLTETDPLGHVTRFAYGPGRRLARITDPRGNTTSNEYDEAGNLISMTDALGNVTRFEYDASGQPVVVTDSAGNIQRLEYDSRGQLVREIDPAGQAITFTRDANGNLLAQTVTRTAPHGTEILTTHYHYDASGRLLSTVLPDGSITSTIYDEAGRPAATLDAAGGRTSMEYDELGRLVRTIHPDGTSEETGYDAEGRRVLSVNALGQTTRFEYDPLGRLVRTVAPDGAETESRYDLAGQLVSSRDARGFETFYGYDLAGRRMAVTNAMGGVALSEYDESGNLVRAVDALGRATVFHYDAMNRRIQTVFADGSHQTSWFDPVGRRTHEQDQDGKVNAFGYDPLGRLTSVTNALGHVTRYAYDEAGLRIGQTDANNRTTTFEYDALGRRTRRTLPGGKTETSDYDAAGRLVSRTDFNGTITLFDYDAMNRLVRKAPAGFAATEYAYNALGMRTQMTDASGSTVYTYDTRNRLASKTRTWRATESVAPFSVTLAYAYDENGNIAGISSSSANGTEVSYEYDAVNRLVGVTDARVGRTAYTYDAAGSLRGYSYPNGVGTAYHYDSLNHLTNIHAARFIEPIANYAYAVGKAGHRAEAVETVVFNARPMTIRRVYQYDALYRLTSETIQAGEPSALPVSSVLAYSYDAVGNRLRRDSTLPQLPFRAHAYDANDRLVEAGYDANGNTRLASIFSPAAGGYASVADDYDAENRLVERNGGEIRVGYDGDGNRVWKLVDGVATYYVVADLNPTGYAQVIEEVACVPADALLSEPVVTRVYTYGTLRISQDRLGEAGWETSFYGYDGHNNVRYLTDASGRVTDIYDYDAFGNLIAAAGETPNHHLFTGEPFDFDLGLYYLRARYHNTDTGRFWTMDSFEGFGTDPRSLHMYLYCHADPVNNMDPSGRYSITEQGMAVAVSASRATVSAGYLNAIKKAALGMLSASIINRYWEEYVPPLLDEMILLSNEVTGLALPVEIQAVVQPHLPLEATNPSAGVLTVANIIAEKYRKAALWNATGPLRAQIPLLNPIMCARSTDNLNRLINTANHLFLGIAAAYGFSYSVQLEKHRAAGNVLAWNYWPHRSAQHLREMIQAKASGDREVFIAAENRLAQQLQLVGRVEKLF